MGGKPLHKRDLLQKLSDKFEFSPDGCWNWTAATFPQGYGAIRIDGKNLRAHRVMYELLVGQIPYGLEIDHLCRNRACINPAHLEPVTHLENIRRGGTGKQARKPRYGGLCKVGHPLTDDNVYVVPSTGKRNCRICRSANRRAPQK